MKRFNVVAAGVPHDNYGMNSATNVAFHLVMAFPRAKSYLGTQLEFPHGFGLSNNTFKVSPGSIDRTVLLKNSVV
ncbi:unnamed protein product [Aspergillus oryzae]|uniref:Unnamed protein product n=2 Tax=Aspergillus oryzae TaxID=5062 RepID=A0AAN5BY66_ASPOZ|nr:unnamed protein product [Aspergillus oryzae]GMF91396.1 unnamed protein product [Aspergillus oryzae]GMG03090.1 unnamed protein product [Aspergillus oryzae]GMG29918.1 unnamed protein product [Aspergillus oryzae]GMG46370.1 unnamed protein product [Aspergillus oryzae var. brunneus]